MQQIRRPSSSIDRSTNPTQLAMQRARAFVVCMVSLVAALALMVACLGAVASRASNGDDPHAHHHHMAPETARTLADYKVPDVTLVREDGKSVSLSNELGDGRPVVLSFIYTTCTTICPLTSMTLSELQRKLGTGRDRVHLVSISVDPEQDTPARLRDYAKKFGAGPEWQHYTGTVAASVASQRAFDVYRGDKMSHIPVTLVHPATGSRWVRIEGFASADQLLAELAPAAAPSERHTD